MILCVKVREAELDAHDTEYHIHRTRQGSRERGLVTDSSIIYEGIAEKARGGSRYDVFASSEVMKPDSKA